jgi:hypothetical protein
LEPGLSSPYRLSTLIKRGCPANWFEAAIDLFRRDCQ